jgi:hypothetical protein
MSVHMVLSITVNTDKGLIRYLMIPGCNDVIAKGSKVLISSPASMSERGVRSWSMSSTSTVVLLRDSADAAPSVWLRELRGGERTGLPLLPVWRLPRLLARTVSRVVPCRAVLCMRESWGGSFTLMLSSSLTVSCCVIVNASARRTCERYACTRAL